MKTNPFAISPSEFDAELEEKIRERIRMMLHRWGCDNKEIIQTLSKDNILVDNAYIRKAHEQVEPK